MEDVQKRLLTLGFDLGSTGVDGVFWGATLAAVRRFQHDRGLAEDGVVGDETWSALVDATFKLGDRLLYLKLPYLHGADVRTVQGALNVLGFACGEPDGIFGAYTERAVGEFQANVGLPADGIAGPETVRAIERLHHVWRGKDPSAPASLAVAPARAAEVLRRTRLAVVADDECGAAIAARVVNLAHATAADAQVETAAGDAVPEDAAVVRVRASGAGSAPGGVPLVTVLPDGPFEGRFIAARAAVPDAREVRVQVPPDACADERTAQSIAVRILDGVCAMLSGEARSVL